MKKISRRSFLHIVGAGMAMGALTACGASSSSTAPASTAGASSAAGEPEEIITLVFADTEVPGMPEYDGNLYFNELVASKTGGRVQIEYHPNNELGGDKEITASCIAGDVDICKCAAGNIADWTDAAAFTDIPGVYKNTPHMRAVWQDGDIRDTVAAQIQADTTLLPIMYDCDGGAARALFYNKDSAVRVPADCKGMKFRTTGSEIEIGLFQALGISPTSMAFTELYTALQNGTIDGIYTHPEGTYGNSLCEVASKCTIINLSFITTFKLLSPKAIEKLGGEGSELYNAVLEAGREAEVNKDELIAAYNEKIEGLMAEVGCEMFKLEADEQQLWYDVAEGLWDQYVGEGKLVSQELFDRIVEIGAGF